MKNDGSEIKGGWKRILFLTPSVIWAITFTYCAADLINRQQSLITGSTLNSAHKIQLSIYLTTPAIMATANGALTLRANKINWLAATVICAANAPLLSIYIFYFSGGI